MLVGLRARRTVLVLPLKFGVGALVCIGLAVHGLLRGAEWKVSAASSVFALTLSWLATTELVAISVEQGLLRVWRPGKRQQLRAPDVAFGVLLRPSTRATEYVVFASDGAERCDLSTHISLTRARRSAERLGEALLEPGHVPGAAAARAVQAQEQEWQEGAAQAQRIVDQYYRSPAWKWSKRVVIGVVTAYVVGLGLYQWLSGAR